LPHSLAYSAGHVTADRDDQGGPSVLFLPEVCARLRISLTTAKRLRRARAFPIPELPSLDARPRFSSCDVDAYITRKTRK
jgi:hypothetical protein